MPFLRESDRMPVLWASLESTRQMPGGKGESTESGDYLGVQDWAVGEVG